MGCITSPRRRFFTWPHGAGSAVPQMQSGRLPLGKCRVCRRSLVVVCQRVFVVDACLFYAVRHLFLCPNDTRNFVFGVVACVARSHDARAGTGVLCTGLSAAGAAGDAPAQRALSRCPESRSHDAAWAAPPRRSHACAFQDAARRLAAVAAALGSCAGGRDPRCFAGRLMQTTCCPSLASNGAASMLDKQAEYPAYLATCRSNRATS
jgi:hypothetical protein